MAQRTMASLLLLLLAAAAALAAGAAASAEGSCKAPSGELHALLEKALGKLQTQPSARSLADALTTSEMATILAWEDGSRGFNRMQVRRACSPRPRLGRRGHVPTPTPGLANAIAARARWSSSGCKCVDRRCSCHAPQLAEKIEAAVSSSQPWKAAEQRAEALDEGECAGAAKAPAARGRPGGEGSRQFDVVARRLHHSLARVPRVPRS